MGWVLNGWIDRRFIHPLGEIQLSSSNSSGKNNPGHESLPLFGVLFSLMVVGECRRRCSSKLLDKPSSLPEKEEISKTDFMSLR